MWSWRGLLRPMARSETRSKRQSLISRCLAVSTWPGRMAVSHDGFLAGKLYSVWTYQHISVGFHQASVQLPLDGTTQMVHHEEQTPILRGRHRRAAVS